MPRARRGDHEFEYEVFGRTTDPPVLLVMGLGAQMIAWRDGFCELLVERGLRVIRFDNRDVGLSTATDAPPPGLGRIAALAVRRSLPPSIAGGIPVVAPYSLSDMASDAVAVLDAVGDERAHVVGASMGGMIAQTMAIEHRERLASLTSVMSTTGNARVGGAAPSLIRQLVAPAPADPAAALEWGVERFRNIAGPLFDEAATREFVEVAHARSYRPAAQAFHLAAVLSATDRTARLRRCDVSTLVVHGERDRLVNPSGGRATASAIPNARLVTYPEMGHDLPTALWEPIADELHRHVRSSAAAPSSGTATIRSAVRGGV